MLELFLVEQQVNHPASLEVTKDSKDDHVVRKSIRLS